jgi:trimeric autotransporter adhesin
MSTEIIVNNDIIEINVTEEPIIIEAPSGAYPLPTGVYSVYGRTGNVVAQEGDYTLTLLGDVAIVTPSTGQVLRYNGTAWVNSTESFVGTVTSVSASVPTGLTIAGSPITTSGTLAIGLQTGYSIPTTASQTTWDTAYNRSLTSAAVTGTTTKTLTLNQQSGGTITASWTDDNTDAVTSVFGRTGAVVAVNGDYSTSLVTEGTNLYYTDARARASNSFSAGSGAYNSTTGVITIPTNNNQITNGAGYITTADLTGYIPYTGATNDLNLGTHNLYANNFFDGFTNVAASGSQIVLTIASTPSYTITGSGGQTIKLPDATTLPNGAIFSFNNNQSSGAITINNNSNTLVVSVPSGGFAEVVLLDNSIAAGSWDRHFKAPSNVSWSTNTLDYAGSITSATWNGNVVAINRGGTGSSTQNFVDLTTTQTIGGAKTFTSALTASSLIKSGGTSSQFLKADGSVDSSSYITLASLSATTPLSYNSSTGDFSISQANTTTNGYLSFTDWNTFNGKQAVLNGTGFVKASGTTISYDNSTYLTTISGITAGGELSGTYANPSLVNSAVTGKVLTGVNITGGTVVDTDSILTAFGKLQNQINGLIGGSIYKGTWNASTNTPTLTSSVGTSGNYYIVSVAGSTNLNGITDWQVGDWAIFQGTTWQKVDNTDSVSSVNGFTGAVSLTTSNISEGSNLYYTNARTIASSLTGYTSGAGTISSSDTILTAIQKLNGNIGSLTTGVSSVFGRTGAVVSATGDYTTSQVTEGSNLYYTDVRARLSITDSVTGIDYNSTTGVFSTTSGYGIPTTASQTNWDTAYTNRITSLTTTGSSGSATLVSNVLNIPTYTLTGLGGVGGSGTTNTLPKFTASSTLGNSNITDSGTLITLGSNTTISTGGLGIGTSSLSNSSLRVTANITGSVSVAAVLSGGVIQTDVTTSGNYFQTSASVVASATVATVSHYTASQGTFNTGSTVTNQYGFFVNTTLTGATSNYAFFSNMGAATGRWSFYSQGTASNYFAGSLGLGTTTLTGYTLNIGKTITGAVTSYAINQSGIVQSDVTTAVYGYRNQLQTAAAAFTLPSYYHYAAVQSTIGSTSAVTSQYGYFVDSTLTGATNNYGFYSAIASGTNRWNLYMAGTAANYMAGSLSIGGLFTSTAFGSNIFSAGGTGYNKLTIRNTTAGTANGAQLSIGSDTDPDQLYIQSFSSTFTTSGMNIAAGAVINGEGAGGLSIAATQSSIGFYTNGSAASNLRMTITSAGNVGIGTTPPTNNGGTNLWLGGTGSINDDGSSFYAGIHNAYYNSGWKYLKSSINSQYYLQDDVGNHIWANAPSGTANGAITFTERMRITGGGNVGIGTSSPSYQLQLSTDSAAKPTSALWTIASDKRIKENISI